MWETVQWWKSGRNQQAVTDKQIVMWKIIFRLTAAWEIPIMRTELVAPSSFFSPS
jgi:hypothetical protein